MASYLTIINKDTIRYEIPGKTFEIPKTNYAKLNVGQIDELVDGIWICWLKGNKWDIVVHGSEILENKLDTTKYFFSTQLPEDDRGIPHETKFRQDNCAIFDFYSMNLSPNKGAIVEI